MDVSTSSAAQDPWDWSTPDVTDYLCGPEGALTRAFGDEPPVRALANCLQHGYVQGVDLLAETSLQDLHTEFGIQPKSMRRVVKNTILELRARSAKFAAWARDNVPPQLVYGHVVSGGDRPRYLSYFEQPSAPPAPLPSIEADVKQKIETLLLTFPDVDRAVSAGESPSVKKTQPSPLAQSFEQRASGLLPPEAPASATSPSTKHVSSPPALTNGVPQSSTANQGVPELGESGRAPRQNEQFVTDATGAKRRRLQLAAPQRTDPPVPSNAGEEPAGNTKADETVEAEYFGQRALPVNDIFYGETPMGQHVYHERLSKVERELVKQDRDLEALDLGQDSASGDKLASKALFRLEGLLEKPPGKTQYVNRRMKYFFLHNDSRNPTTLQQGNERRLAILPYGERLASRLRRDVASVSVLKGDLWHRVSREEWLDDLASAEAASADAASANDAGGNDPYRYLDLDKYIKAGQQERSEDAISVFGRDLEDETEFSEDLQREINEEKAEHERERQRALLAPKLSATEVVDTIAAARAAFLDGWRKRKIPILEKGAFALWKKSRDRRHGRALQVACHGEIARLERRLGRFTEDLRRAEWPSAAALKAQTDVLEITWADIEKEQWKLRVIARPTAPARPPKAPKPKAKAAKAMKFRHEKDENVDVLESDEDDDDDGFVDDSGLQQEELQPLQKDGNTEGEPPPDAEHQQDDEVPHHAELPLDGEPASTDEQATIEAISTNQQLPHAQDGPTANNSVAMTEEIPSVEAPPAAEAFALDEDLDAAAPPPLDEPMDWEAQLAASEPSPRKRVKAADFFSPPPPPLFMQSPNPHLVHDRLSNSDETMNSNLSRNKRVPSAPGSDSEAVVSENSQDSLLSRNQDKAKQSAGAAHDVPAGSGQDDAASDDSDVVTPSKRRSQRANDTGASGGPSADVVDLTLDTDPSSSDESPSLKAAKTASVVDAPVQPKMESPESAKQPVIATPSQNAGKQDGAKEPQDAHPEWPPEYDIVAISELDNDMAEKLAAEGDRQRLLVWMVTRTDRSFQTKTFKFLEGRRDNVLLPDIIDTIKAMRAHATNLRNLEPNNSDACFQIASWYLAWKFCHKPDQRTGLPRFMVEIEVDMNGDNFGDFYNALTEVVLQIKQQLPFPKRGRPMKSLAMKEKGGDISPDEQNSFWNTNKQSKGTAGPKAAQTSKTAKGRKFQVSQAGIDLREGAQRRAAQRKLRAAELQRTLGPDRLPGSQQAATIVNLSHKDDEDDIIVNPFIANRIHKHQVEGVQFLWDEVVSAGSGCLLAHTMGLGKTMQCVTFLVTLAEAAQSSNEQISKQIPEQLRVPHTIILCPPALVQNWHDELLTWIPPSSPVIGIEQVRQLTSSLSVGDRLYEFGEWNKDGGILLMPYTMLAAMTLNKSGRSELDLLSLEDREGIKEALLKNPAIVIADEAHTFKNPTSQASLAVHQFATKSRIALTGSPLSNHLEEYFSILNWVEEGYLGSLSEFKMNFATPIKSGIYQESSRAKQRLAIRKLAVLKKDLEPKVNRADFSVLRGALQGMTQFIIRLPLSDLQRQCYSQYVDSVQRGTMTGLSMTSLWARIAILTLLCAHPRCYQAKLLGREEKDDTLMARKKSPSSDDVSRDEDENADEGEKMAEEPVEKIGLDPTMVAEQKALLDQASVELASVDSSYKMRMLMEIADLVEETGEKLLIFSQRLPVLSFVEEQLKRRGKKTERLDGKGNVNDRQQLTQRFNTGSTQIMLISTKAGGTGLNLQAANRVVILDFHFNPVHEQQAIGRACRIGQQKHVFVYRLVIGGSFEETLLNQGFFKIGLATRVVDKKNLKQHTRGDLLSYMEPLKEPEQENLQRFMGWDPLVMDRILAKQGDNPFIRSIQPVETFLEEKPEELTAEEQEEAAREMEAIKLRRTDPEAFRKMQQQDLQDAARRHMSGQTALPPSSTAPQSPATSLLVPPPSTAPQPSASTPSAPLPSAVSSLPAQPLMHKFRANGSEVGPSVPQPAATRNPDDLRVYLETTAALSKLVNGSARSGLARSAFSDRPNPRTPPRRSSPSGAARPNQTSIDSAEGAPAPDLQPSNARGSPSRSAAQNDIPPALRDGTPQPVRPPRDVDQQPSLPNGSETAASNARLGVPGHVPSAASGATLPPSSASGPLLPPAVPSDSSSPNTTRSLAKILADVRASTREELKSTINGLVQGVTDLPKNKEKRIVRLVHRIDDVAFRKFPMSETGYKAKMEEFRSTLTLDKVREKLYSTRDTDSSAGALSRPVTPLPGAQPGSSQEQPLQLTSASASFTTDGRASTSGSPLRQVNDLTMSEPESPRPASTNAVDLAASESPRPVTRSRAHPGPNADLAALSTQTSSARIPAFPDGPPAEAARPQSAATSTSAAMNPVEPPRQPARNNHRGNSRPGDRTAPSTPRPRSKVSSSFSNVSRSSASSNPFRRPPSAGTLRRGSSSGYRSLDQLRANEMGRGRGSFRGRNRANGNGSTQPGRQAR